jgi:hypothetical protein
MRRPLRRLTVAVLWVPLAAAASAAGSPTASTTSEPAPAAAALGRLTVELKLENDARSLLPARDLRRLAEARRRLELQSAFATDAELDRVFEGMRSVVRASYVTLYRGTLQRRRAADAASRSRTSDGAASPAWQPRFQPRVTLGDRGYLSARVTLPHAPLPLLERLSLEARHGYGDRQTGLAIRYQDGDRRSLRLEGTAGDPATGRRVAFHLALRF